MRNSSRYRFCVSRPIIRLVPPVCRSALLLALSLATFVLVFPLSAQNSNAKADDAAGGKKNEIKAAQKPKSEKWRFSFLPVGMQKNPQADFTIITEMTDEGRKLPEPSFGKPVYYISHSVGQRDVGDSYAGTHAIEYKYLEKQLNNALASNGYRPADLDHPATQVLFIAWGMHNRIIKPEEDGEIDSEADTDMTPRYTVDINDVRNLLSRAKVVGGQKFANEFSVAMFDQLEWTTDLRAKGPLRNFAERDTLTESLVEQIFEDCYFLLVTSMDFEALKHNEKKVLWTTKISTTARGISFEASLPNMIENGAYYFGREMTIPDIVTKRMMKKGTVEIGEATVQEYYMSGTAVPSGTTQPAPSGTTPATK